MRIDTNGSQITFGPARSVRAKVRRTCWALFATRGLCYLTRPMMIPMCRQNTAWHAIVFDGRFIGFSQSARFSILLGALAETTYVGP